MEVFFLPTKTAQLRFNIKRLLRQNFDDRSALAKTEAAGFDHLNILVQALLLFFFADISVDAVAGAGRNPDVPMHTCMRLRPGFLVLKKL